MKTKLTLSVDKDLARYAYAQTLKDGESVSSTFSKFLLSRKAQIERQNIPKVTDTVGSLKAYSIADSKVAIRTHYAKKFSNLG